MAPGSLAFIRLALHHILIGTSDSLHIHGLVDDPARMEPVEKPSCEGHEESIKNVDKILLGLKHAVLAHDIFSNAKHGSHENEEAGRVKHVEELLPGSRDLEGLLGGLSADSKVENEGDDHEEAEEEDLNAQTSNDDVFASLDSVLVLSCCEHAAA